MHLLCDMQAIGVAPPPVYSPGDFGIGHTVLTSNKAAAAQSIVPCNLLSSQAHKQVNCRDRPAANILP